MGLLLSSKELQLRDAAKGRDLSEQQKAANRQLELEIKDVRAYVQGQLVGFSLADFTLLTAAGACSAARAGSAGQPAGPGPGHGEITMSASNRLMGATAWKLCERAALTRQLSPGGQAGNTLRRAGGAADSPESPDERASADETAFMRCAQAAIDLAASYESDLRDAVFSFFQELAAMRPRRRAMLEASIAGALVGLGMGR